MKKGQAKELVEVTIMIRATDLQKEIIRTVLCNTVNDVFLKIINRKEKDKADIYGVNFYSKGILTVEDAKIFNDELKKYIEFANILNNMEINTKEVIGAIADGEEDKFHEFIDNAEFYTDNVNTFKAFLNKLFAEEEKEFNYTTDFRLTAPVIDYDEAYNYLTEDDMTKYAKDDSRCNSFKDDLISIRWELEDEIKGHIDVKTTRALTNEELEDLSSWISGQNSDGLGEGFEQQDFACYNDEEVDEYEEEYDDDFYSEYYVMASFDWKDNDYELRLA